jgi:MoaA/NifB/PqqE/SkfB family radical SAM enzyme
MIIRAKTKYLFEGKALTAIQQQNSQLNLKEIDDKIDTIESMPRRLVFELTNKCNLNCVMCGRSSAEFKPTVFNMDWFYKLEPLMDIVEEVTLMGWGEPTIHPNFSEMLKIIDKHSARKYFCTNGMRLDTLIEDIFKYHVDVFAVSVDGAKPETNNRIRRGSDLNQIVSSLRNIVRIKKERNLLYPYINFVFCAMKSNLDELCEVIELAADIGLEEVKVVYLTAFDATMAEEVLWECEERLHDVFIKASELAQKLGVILKLPHIPGTDPAGDNSHKECFVAWRDFFLGSDGYVRTCMSTPNKLLPFDVDVPFKEFWNHEEFKKYRRFVNDEEHMDEVCKRCYQSSHCNWNKRHSFFQTEELFAPSWEGKQ